MFCHFRLRLETDILDKNPETEDAGSSPPESLHFEDREFLFEVCTYSNNTPPCFFRFQKEPCPLSTKPLQDSGKVSIASPHANFKFQSPFHLPRHYRLRPLLDLAVLVWPTCLVILVISPFLENLGTKKDPFKPNSTEREGYKFASYSKAVNQKTWINPGFCSEYYLDLLYVEHPKSLLEDQTSWNHRFPTGAPVSRSSPSSCLYGFFSVT